MGYDPWVDPYLKERVIRIIDVLGLNVTNDRIALVRRIMIADDPMDVDLDLQYKGLIRVEE